MSEAVAFTCKPLGACRVVRARGVEAMNALPSWTVDVLCVDAEIDLEALLQEPALLELVEDREGPARSIPLFVTDAAYVGSSRDGHRYSLELSAGVGPLRLRSGYRIFQKKTTQEIVAEVLLDAGISANQVVWRLAGRYAQRVQCVQYAESEWAFIERLLADEGIAYWCDADDGAPRLLFGDTGAAHESIDGDMHVPFVDASGMSPNATSFFELTRIDELTHDTVHVRDYDVRHPDVLIEGRAGDGALGWFEFPAGVPQHEAAEARATVRLEQLRRLEVHARAKSGCARLQPGRVVRIDGAADEGFDGEWLIVEVRHEITESAPNAVGERPYRNSVLLVPWKVGEVERTFRPAVPVSRPRIEGIETAYVTGAGGEEIHVNDLGSVTLALPWDPSGQHDETSSCWVRTLQMNMGGSMLLPRVGWEVALGYIDGNPDEPFALGQVYNATNAPPYPLPAKKATSAIRSDTSPHDGSTNEIRFGDTAGSQEMFVHASNTQGVSVGGSALTKVSVNETHDIGGRFALHVAGTQLVTIGAAQDIAVGSDAATTVKGARTEVIGGSERIGVTASRRVKIGTYSELVGAFYGLQCNMASTTVQGSYREVVGGNLVTAAGLGVNQSVAAARIELVGGARNVVAMSGCEEKVSGPKAVSIKGAAKEAAGADVVTEASTGSIHVAGSASFTAGGNVRIEATTISLSVSGDITAKGGSTLVIGGTVKAEGGTTKLAASTVKRTSGAKVDA